MGAETDEVLAAAAAWTWTPYDATVVETDHVTLAVRHGTATVNRAEGADAAKLVVAVLRLAGANEADAVLWPVRPGTGPADLGTALQRVGAEIHAVADISSFDLSGPLPSLDVPPDVAVELVNDLEQLEQAYPVAAAAFDEPPASAQFRATEAAQLAEQVALGEARQEFRFLARIGGEVVGSGGVTVDGPAARLWGAGVHPDARGRGAYRAVLAARLRIAAQLGARFALVKARSGTSAPILRRAGFVAHGQEITYKLVVRRPSASHYVGLPSKIIGAGAVFFDAEGRVLIVEPSYKDHWEIPGGVVEDTEPPYAGARREVLEEIGIDRALGRLLVIDWAPPRGRRPVDIMAFVFDGGVLSAEEIASIRLQDDELRSYRFCRVDDTVNEAEGLLPPILTKRVVAAVRARQSGLTAYLEGGEPVT
jgi:8-oxo-dGTP pyrophosphatase MutT (NUDIX family)/ribosomal protein S18 acetylase RimI-like enzyme